MIDANHAVEFLRECGKEELAAAVERLQLHERQARAAAAENLRKYYELKNKENPLHEYRGGRFVGD